MNRSRVEILLEYYRGNPQDPFNAYALALEYMKVDKERAKEFFELLMKHHPEYLPTYYHAAGLYEDLGETERAIDTYKNGISLASRLNESKALRELQAALDTLMSD